MFPSFSRCNPFANHRPLAHSSRLLSSPLLSILPHTSPFLPAAKMSSFIYLLYLCMVPSPLSRPSSTIHILCHASPCPLPCLFYIRLSRRFGETALTFRSHGCKWFGNFSASGVAITVLVKISGVEAQALGSSLSLSTSILDLIIKISGNGLAVDGN